MITLAANVTIAAVTLVSQSATASCGAGIEPSLLLIDDYAR